MLTAAASTRSNEGLDTKRHRYRAQQLPLHAIGDIVVPQHVHTFSVHI